MSKFLADENVPTALAGWRQGKHLGEANLMSDQIAVQQLVAGLDQGRQRHPQQGQPPPARGFSRISKVSIMSPILRSL